MQNNNNGFRVLGVLLILSGFILPWRCYSGFTLGCDQSFSFDLPGSFFSVPEFLGSALVVVVFLAIGLSTAGFDLKRILLALVSLSFTGIFFLMLPAYFQRGLNFTNLMEFFMLSLSALTTWMVFLSTFNWLVHAHRYVIASASTLGLAALVSIAQTLWVQFGSGSVETMIRLQVGLPLVLLGSWLVISFQPLPESGKKQHNGTGLETGMSQSPDWLN